MTDEEVFMNFRKRHERDLEGLINNNSEAASDPHIDRPLQKAIEYFEDLLVKKKVAA